MKYGTSKFIQGLCVGMLAMYLLSGYAATGSIDIHIPVNDVLKTKHSSEYNKGYIDGVKGDDFTYLMIRANPSLVDKSINDYVAGFEAGESSRR